MRNSRTTLAALGAALLLLAPMAPAGAGTLSTTAVPFCGNGDLTASYRATDAAAGHQYGRLRLTNTGDHDCKVRGFGGLSYVGGGDGTQIGAAADRTGKGTPTVLLAPGERAVSRVDEVNALNFPRRTCRPTDVDGFRVYVPDSDVAQFVKHPTTGCRKDGVHLLSHRSYR